MTGLGCGCCAGGRHDATAAGAWNAPGLNALQRRVARYPDALDRMIARLSDEGRPALKHLTTRDPSDPSIAILDAWACLEDVLTFYDERIANEGYLRTATDRDALAGIAALVGYRPRPGVAASTFLAFEMEQGHDARLDAGMRVRSVPKPGEESQTFESIEGVEAREAWNKLFPQMRRPQVVPFEEALSVPTLWFEGAVTGLTPGDAILLYYDDEPGHQVIRTVRQAVPEQDETKPAPLPTRTRADLTPVDTRLQNAFTFLMENIADETFRPIANDLALGAGAAELLDAIGDPPLGGGDDPFKQVRAELQDILDRPEPQVAADGIRIPPLLLLQALTPPAAGASAKATVPAAGPDDRAARVLAVLAGVPPRRLIDAWRASEVSLPRGGAQTFVLRRVVGLLGHNAPPKPTSNHHLEEWEIAPDERPNVLFLEDRIPEVAAGAHIVTRHADVVREEIGKFHVVPVHRMHRVAASVTTINRSAYGISGTVSRVDVSPAWWSLDPQANDSDDRPAREAWMTALRGTSVYCASQPLSLADEPDETPLGACTAIFDVRAADFALVTQGDAIRLDRLVDGLEPGRTVIVSGVRATAAGSSAGVSLGVRVSEVATIVAATHETEADRPDGPTRTTIRLAAPLRECYVRSSVAIFANIAAATHGDTRAEILGNGDARVAGQTFRTQPGQLTFVAGEDVTGVASTLEVRVDDVRWLEVDPGDERGPAEHVFTTAPSGSDRTLVRFGDGVDGARPRTGQQNVRARYRVGIGAQANVDADALTTLVTRPLGLRSVTNPVPATGGAGPDGPDAIRERAPLGITALGRLVGVQDYADFALEFAGVAKAVATALPIDGRTSVHVTVTAPDNAPIEPGSPLIRRLTRALRAYGDPLMPVVVEPARRALLVLAARIRLQPGHRWSDVEPRVRLAVLRRFAFVGRRIGQDALLSDVVATIGADDGVDYVDVDGWGYLSEQQVGSSLDDFAETLSAILAGAAGQDQRGRLVMHGAIYTSKGGLRPAWIGYMDPRLPETFVLTEITDAGR